MIDTLRRHETPEGVELTLRLAGPLARSAAWLIDAALRLLVYCGLAIALGMLGGGGLGIFLLAVFCLEWFGAVPFEIGRHGATPGKRILGLRVVHRDGTPVGASASVVRNLLRAVDFFPFAYGIGLVTMLASREFQRLGDHAAGTLVVHAERAGKRARPWLRRERDDGAIEREPARLPAPVAPPLPLTLEERQALGELAARAATWSQARRIELANILAPLTGLRGEANLERVLAMAAWSEGQA